MSTRDKRMSELLLGGTLINQNLDFSKWATNWRRGEKVIYSVYVSTPLYYKLLQDTEELCA